MNKEFIVFDPEVSYASIDDKDILVLIDLVRQGIKFTSFINLAKKSPFSLIEWSDFLHLSERTMQRYRKEKKTFDTIQSEKILQITLLYNYGIDVFGSTDKFYSWLESKNVALGGVKPKELMDNSFGVELLKDELTRIEHGVLA
ncbi:MAG TPA: antitoxin Xre/MbcA/ParS toxin-binding domain-containing protein [Bacteroidia bacterium]|nr:antitoxin Xre/MbcA/ParS toxin-binding domain-containing protein [Bacteroidia bacterium]